MNSFFLFYFFQKQKRQLGDSLLNQSDATQIKPKKYWRSIKKTFSLRWALRRIIPGSYAACCFLTTIPVQVSTTLSRNIGTSFVLKSNQTVLIFRYSGTDLYRDIFPITNMKVTLCSCFSQYTGRKLTHLVLQSRLGGGKNTQNPSSLFPKRDSSPKRVKMCNVIPGTPEYSVTLKITQPLLSSKTCLKGGPTKQKWWLS